MIELFYEYDIFYRSMYMSRETSSHLPDSYMELIHITFACHTGTIRQAYSYAMIGNMNHSDQQPILELHAVVTGHVQGVGFRYFVVEQAQRLGLQGYARNQANGNVEVVAQGIRPALEHLLALLRQGPRAAQVDEVQTTWRQPTIHTSNFHIRF
jgi:acylphosphatase